MQLLVDLAEGPEHGRVDAALHVDVDPVKAVALLVRQVGLDKAVSKRVLLRLVTGFVHPRARAGRAAKGQHVLPRVHRDASRLADILLGGHALVGVHTLQTRVRVDEIRPRTNPRAGVWRSCWTRAHIRIDLKGAIRLELISKGHRDHIVPLLQRIGHGRSLFALIRRVRIRTPVGDEQLIKGQVLVARTVALVRLLVDLGALGQWHIVLGRNGDTIAWDVTIPDVTTRHNLRIGSTRRSHGSRYDRWHDRRHDRRHSRWYDS
jgi:hypothetical protein